MKTCPNCFSDKELHAFLSSSKEIGKCDVCSSIDVPILDVTELLDFFHELLSNFSPNPDGESLKSKIQANWSFFANHVTAKKILNHVLPLLSTSIANADSPVEFSSEIIQNVGYWDTLTEELKWSRRFLSDVSYLTDELGWDGFFNVQFELQSSARLYRARLHHQSGQPVYGPDKLKCPDPKISSGGRANPIGIPVLYLSDSIETTIYEVRASYLDEVSVGEFKVADGRNSIKVVDFTEEPSLYRPGRVVENITAHLLKQRISRELSKPMRRYDSEIEYIPTQFICEFIRIITGADGIRFASSVHAEGKNIVVFDQKLMECISSETHRVDRLKISHNRI